MFKYTDKRTINTGLHYLETRYMDNLVITYTNKWIIIYTFFDVKYMSPLRQKICTSLQQFKTYNIKSLVVHER